MSDDLSTLAKIEIMKLAVQVVTSALNATAIQTNPTKVKSAVAIYKGMLKAITASDAES